MELKVNRSVLSIGIAVALTLGVQAAVSVARFPGEANAKTGWRLESSEAGKVVYIPFEGYYESKGGRIESPRFKLDKSTDENAYYRLSFSAKCETNGYWWVDLYDAKGNLLPDINSRLYASKEWQHYDVMVPACPDAAEAVIAFVSDCGAFVRDVAMSRVSVDEAAAWCDKTYAALPQLDIKVSGDCWDKAPKARAALSEGRDLNVVLLGDSIMNDTYCGLFTALVQRAFPKSKIRFTLSVRGSTGCWYYHEKANFEEYVAKYKPDLVLIGGISNYLGKQKKQTLTQAEDWMAETIGRCQEIGAEVIVCTPPPSYEFRKEATVQPFDGALKTERSEFLYLQQEYERRAAARTDAQVWDLTTAPCEAIARSGKPLNWFKRDRAHNDDRGKQLIAQTMAACFVSADKESDGVRQNALDADAIVNGVHGYMPDNYVVPKEPDVRGRLEWFKDQKLAIMMHFGMYSQMGILESWALCDSEASWSRRQIDWTADGEAFKRQYWDLWKSFNPTRFQPQKWAKLAKDNGFKYIIFTTKHHDGFCLFDTKHTDFKVTNPACPFSKNPRADIVKNVFDAFRAEGLGIAAYFSKPDWHNEDFWEDHGVGRQVTRMPTYDVKANPTKWAKFREFTKNQIVELVRDYGPMDIIWLDGGQVQRKCGLDINIEEIVAEARKYKSDLISVDRTAGGSCENVITPEQTVPPEPLAVPWESCITMGTGFSYRYDDEYKSPRELVHLLLDVVAKGGNLALNVAPGPDGRLPYPAIERMEAMGAWLRANGRGVYATRPVAPFAKDAWRFSRSKDAKTVYAFRLWKEGERDCLAQVIPVENAESVVSVRHLATRAAVPSEKQGGGLAIRLPETFRTNPYADGFELVIRQNKR